MTSITELVTKHFPSLKSVKVTKRNNTCSVYANANDARPSLIIVKPYLTDSSDIEKVIQSSPILKIRHCWNMGLKERAILEKYPELVEVSINDVFDTIGRIKGGV